MSRPEFNKSISLGNMLQMGALVVALAVGWFTMEARGADNATRIVENRSTFSDLEIRVRGLENGSVRLEERLRSMQDILLRIERRLATMERG